MPTDGTFGTPKNPISPRNKRLTREQIEAATERLTRSPRRVKDLPPLVEQKKLDSEEMERSVQRLYSQSVTLRRTALEAAERKAHPDLVKRITLDEETLDGRFQQLYNAADQHKRNLETLRARYEAKERGKQSENDVTRRLTKEEIISSGHRLHDEAIAKSKESQAKLFDKYVTATDVKVAKMSAADLEQASDRLHRNEPRPV